MTSTGQVRQNRKRVFQHVLSGCRKPKPCSIEDTFRRLIHKFLSQSHGHSRSKLVRTWIDCKSVLTRNTRKSMCKEANTILSPNHVCLQSRIRLQAACQVATDRGGLEACHSQGSQKRPNPKQAVWRIVAIRI